MKPLLPLPRLDKRREKVAGHYFRPVEAWWEVSGQAREQWSADHRLLAEAGALEGGGWLAVDRMPAVVDAFERGHRSWFSVAEQAFLTGDVYAHPDPSTRFYVGAAGVLAVVAAPDEQPRLVTSFRPEPLVAGNPVGDTATGGYLKKNNARAVARAAVRRIVRGASR